MSLSTMSLVVSFVLTAVLYGAGPLLLRLWKNPILPKSLKWLHIGYTAILALAFAAYNSFNEYKVNLYPALLWGGIFYWWNRSYFDKRSYIKNLGKASPHPGKWPVSAHPATPAQVAPALPDTVLSEPELPARIPPEKGPKRTAPHALTIILAAALVLSLIGNVWQAIAWNSEGNAMAAEIREKDKSISTIKSAITSLKSELYDLQEYHFDTYYSTGYIVNGSNYFHRYDCPVVEAADTYQSHNTEFCKWLGYGGCPVCNSGFSISKIDKNPKQSAP